MEDLGWAERVRIAAVVAEAVVVGTFVVDIGVEAVGMCEKTKVRDDVSSEAADGPIRWDSRTEVVPSG